MNWELLLEGYLPHGAELDAPPLSRSAQKRLLAQTLEKAGLPAARPKRRISLPRRLIAACAAALLLISAAGAAGTLLVDSRLQSLWDGGDPETVTAVQLGQSSENAGYTLTLLQAAGDQHLAYFLLELEGPQGEVLGPGLLFSRVDFQLPDPSAMGWQCEQLEDGDPADSRASFLLVFESDTEFTGQAVTITLSGLCDTLDADRILAAGSWHFEAPLALDSPQRTVRPGGVLQRAGGSLHLDSVTVTPVSVSVILRRDLLEMLLHGDAFDFSLPTLTVELADGTLLTGADLITGSSGSRDARVTLRAGYRRILDPAEVTAVMLDGERFPL